MIPAPRCGYYRTPAGQPELQPGPELLPCSDRVVGVAAAVGALGSWEAVCLDHAQLVLRRLK